MSARSGLAGKKPRGSHLGPSEAFALSWTEKNPKDVKTIQIFLGGPMGPIHPVWALAAIHPRWGIGKLVEQLLGVTMVLQPT